MNETLTELLAHMQAELNDLGPTERYSILGPIIQDLEQTRVIAEYERGMEDPEA